MKNKKYLLSLLIGAVFVACNDRPDDILSESETIDLLADLELAEAYNNSPSSKGGTSFRSNLQESVLAAHGVSEEKFEATMAYYARNIDDYYELYDKIDKRIKKKGEKLIGKINETAEGNDMWPYSRFVYFSRNNASDGMRFSIDPGELQQGERLEWKFNLTSADGVEGMFGVEYTDGTSSFAKRNAAGSKHFSLSLQSDTARIAKRVFGYVTMPERSMPVWADSIQLLRLPYDSMEYGKIKLQQKVTPLRNKPKTEVKKEEEKTTTEVKIDTSSSTITNNIEIPR